jgi:hypothetical protein
MNEEIFGIFIILIIITMLIITIAAKISIKYFELTAKNLKKILETEQRIKKILEKDIIENNEKILKFKKRKEGENEKDRIKY